MKRTSPLGIVALAVAILALVASMGGASYAAKLITGKDIKNGSITGKDVKSKSLTGKQVKDKSLTGADVKDGSIAAADLKTGTLPSVDKVTMTATAGASTDAARAAAPEHVLFSAGPLTVYAKCYSVTTTTYVETFVKTTQNFAVFDSDNDEASGGAVTDYLNTDTVETDRGVMSTSASADSASYYGNHSSDFHAWGPEGTVISAMISVGAKSGTLAGGNGPWGAGNTCVATGNFFQG